MEISRQNQNAGDNSQQLQVGSIGNLTIVNGITEQRAREIFYEMNEIARRDYTSDAYELALKRVTAFESLLMTKVQKVDGMLEAFGDPSFQYVLAEAQRRAAATEREGDFATLAELLECRVTHGGNRKLRTGINQAVKIVDEIDDDALCGMTLIYFFREMIPLAGMCAEGLSCLENCAQKLLFTNLPRNNEWLDHLEILSTIRRYYYSSMTKIEEILFKGLPGYVCVGINKTSEAYTKAVDILARANLPPSMLVDHELLDGFVRLPVSNINHIQHVDLRYGSTKITHSLNLQECNALRQVWNLYSKDAKLIAAVKTKFISELQKYPTLNNVRMWWSRIPNEIELTQVGVVLAHANAKRLDHSVPDFLE